ncbi:MAG: ABC transporter permease [Planctomycetes bacterium]|nr:ABC transporter permease [Planctomycetota bacterium]
MGAFLLRRLLWMIPTLVGITLLTFLAVHAAPGDLAARVGDAESVASAAGSSGDDRELFRAEHLLDAPLWKQYLHFVGPFDLSPQGASAFGGSGAHPWHGVLALDFGTEFQRPGVPVLPEIGARLAVTGPLALLATLLLFLVGVPLGVASALSTGGLVDRAARGLLLALHSVPGYALGLALILLFGATGWGLLPVLGAHAPDAEELSFGARLLDRAAHAVLPLATLCLPGLAYVARQTRAAVLEVLDADFVRAARARGLAEKDVLVRHVLRNALLPIVTLLASILPALLGGSVIVETLYGLPGLGSYAYEGLLARDLNVILGVTTTTAVATLAAILAADVASAWLDPRVRTEVRGG